MTLKWTKKKPTKPGWYWVRWQEPMVVNVDFNAWGKISIIHPGSHTEISKTNYAWAGPIPEPTNPKKKGNQS